MYQIMDYDKKYEEQLIKLWVDVCVEEYGFEEWREGMSIVEEEIYEKIMIAVSNGQVVGSMAYMNKGDNVAEIKRVYIYSQFRGCGLAQKMLDLIVDEIENKKYEKIFIETWSKFSRGVNFYTKNNFLLKEKIGDCYRYEKELHEYRLARCAEK